MDRTRLRLRAALATLVAGVASLPLLALVPALPGPAALGVLGAAVVMSVVVTWRMLPPATPSQPLLRGRQ